MNYLFKGAATALYTPFSQNGIDFAQLENLIDRQIKGKINALVLLGTTGEAPTVTAGERKELIEFTVKRVKGKFPLIVGTGSNCTATACQLTKEAKELGADGALVVTPYYNRCEQDGLYEHYKEICIHSNFPVICYNVPSRTCVNIEPETAEKLCGLDFMVGIKEASQSSSHVIKMLEALNEKMPVYCGNDSMIGLFCKNGGRGQISVLSNIIPSIIVDITNDFKSFYDRRYEKLAPIYNELCNTVFEKVNPIGIKLMAEILFKEKCVFRLPLTRPDDAFYQKLGNLSKRLKQIKEFNLC